MHEAVRVDQTALWVLDAIAYFGHRARSYVMRPFRRQNACIDATFLCITSLSEYWQHADNHPWEVATELLMQLSSLVNRRDCRVPAMSQCRHYAISASLNIAHFWENRNCSITKCRNTRVCLMRSNALRYQHLCQETKKIWSDLPVSRNHIDDHMRVEEMDGKLTEDHTQKRLTKRSAHL